jgi:hypothetical protein
MGRDWVFANLDIAFDQKSRLHWLCAMLGYSYVNAVYKDVYAFLKSHGDLSKALDEPALRDRVIDKVVQDIAIGYLNGFEDLNDQGSLIRLLIARNEVDELGQLVWFIWTLRDNKDSTLATRVLPLWQMIAAGLDVATKKGKQLASQLCQWSIFVGKLEPTTKALLLQIAPFADESHNSPELLRSVARLSDTDPIQANEIWLAMLRGGARSDYPEESIRQVLGNLVALGDEGKRVARSTVSEYLRYGVERPHRWLEEILRVA